MSPRSTLENEKIRTESINKILEAAFKLMARNGYEATSISQIAAEAGISKGLMYNYFNSKEELLKAIIDRTLQDGEEIMKDVFSEDAAETLENVFKWYFEELRNNLHEWTFISEIMLKAERYPFVKEMVMGKVDVYIELYSSLLSELGYKDPIGEAYVLAGLFDGIGFQCLVLGDKYPIDRMEKYLIDRYCKQNQK